MQANVRTAMLGPVRAHRASVRANGGHPRFPGSPCFNGWLVLSFVWFAIAMIGAALILWLSVRGGFAIAFVVVSVWTWKVQRHRWCQLREEFLAGAMTVYSTPAANLPSQPVPPEPTLGDSKYGRA